MAEESKQYTETEIMFGALDRIVREEMKKRPSKRDNKLIDECIAEMAKLKNVRAGYTEEEIGAIVEQLQERAAENAPKTPRRPIRVRRMVAVVCAACLIVGCGVATVAWNPLSAVKEWIIDITNTSSGTMEAVDNIAYTKYDEVVKYNNIYDLIKTEKLDVYYPAVLPETLSITRVEVMVIDNREYINFHFNDSDYVFTIQPNTSLYLNIPEYETVKTNIATFYLSHQNDKYIARCNIDSDLYLIECSDYEDIKLMINNITKGY